MLCVTFAPGLAPLQAEPNDVPTWAEQLAELVGEGEIARAKAHWAEDAGDPWLLAECLLDRGAHDALVQLLPATSTSDRHALERHVRASSARRDRPLEAVLEMARLAEHDSIEPDFVRSRFRTVFDASLESPSVAGVLARSLLADALLRQGRSEDAKAGHEAARTEAAALGWQAGEMRLLDKAIDDALARGRPQDAVPDLLRVLALDEDFLDAARTARWAAILGGILLGDRSYQRALRWLEESTCAFDCARTRLADGTIEAPSRTELLARANLARARSAVGDLAGGLAAWQEAELHAMAGSDEVRAYVQDGLGLLLHTLGRYDEAVAAGREASRIAAALSPASFSIYEGNLARSLSSAQQWEDAEAIWARCIDAFERDGRAAEAVASKLNLTATWLDQGELGIAAPPSLGQHAEGWTTLRRAHRLLNEVIRTLPRQQARAGDQTWMELGLNAQALLGRATRLLEEPKQAMRELEVLADDELFDNRPLLESYVRRHLAIAAHAAGDHARALREAEAALKLDDEAQAGLTSADVLSILANEDRSAFVRAAASAALHQDSTDRLLAMMESLRSRSLLLAMQRADAGPGRTPSPGAEIAAAGQLAELRRELRELATRLHDGLRAGSLRKGERFEIVLALRSTLMRLRRTLERSERGEAVALPLPQALADDQVGIYCGLVSAGPYAVVLFRGRTTVHGPTSAVLPRLLESRAAASTHSLGHASANRMLNDGAAALAELLPANAPSDARVVVFPQGPFAVLPWIALGSLVRDGNETLRPTVSLSPSRTAMAVLARRPAVAARGILALGDPNYFDGRSEVGAPLLRGAAGFSRLPYSLAEVRAIGSGESDRVLAQDEATEESLYAALSGIGPLFALHLSCHGYVDVDSPELAALVLKPGPSHDGLLTLPEVRALRLHTNLVALSCCETGLGQEVAGEGLVGLVPAFLIAGARRVVAGLWRVPDDASAFIMVEFHRLLRVEGLHPEEALVRAMTAARRATTDKGVPRWPHPLAWAGWTLWGEPSRPALDAESAASDTSGAPRK